jgi:hypothetical protein
MSVHYHLCRRRWVPGSCCMQRRAHAGTTLVATRGLTVHAWRLDLVQLRERTCRNMARRHVLNKPSWLRTAMASVASTSPCPWSRVVFRLNQSQVMFSLTSLLLRGVFSLELYSVSQACCVGSCSPAALASGSYDGPDCGFYFFLPLWDGFH